MAAKFPQISTHKISVSLLANVIGENGKTKVRMLGVQPGSLRPGQPLSPAVQKTVDILVDMLCELLVSGKEPAARMAEYEQSVPICEDLIRK